MNTFVTLDLDYWTILESFHSSHTDVMYSLIKRAKCKTRVIKLHHHLVSYNMIPKDTEHVINIDFHNDIVDDDHTFNEGTWGNFMPKSVRKFTWIYPSYQACIREKAGICVGTADKPKITHVKYKRLEEYSNTFIPNQINKFVICLSKNWAEHDMAPYLKFINRMRSCGLIK